MKRIQGNTYLNCRRGVGRGHSWDEIPVTKKPSFGVAIWWRCTECHSERRYIYSQHNGDVLSRQYKHPKDWAKLPRAEFSNADLRLMYLRERAREQSKLRRQRKSA